MSTFDDLPVSTIETALSYVNPDCEREIWARIGMAIKAELGDAGFDVWDAWSRTGASYQQRDARDTWRSIRASGGVTIATLIHLAREAGYTPEARPKTIDPAEAAARRARREADQAREQAEREEAQARAAVTAGKIWDAAEPIDGRSHPYLDRKGITDPGQVRLGVYWRWHADAGAEVEVEDALLIPIRTPDRKLVSLQAIFPDDRNALGRDRDYLPGGRKQGAYFNLGMPTGKAGELVLIGEGYATCASARAATGAFAVVAFDAGNLEPVALAIHAKLPEARIVILADDDRFGKNNTGVGAARKAAAAVGGLVAVPRFASDEGQPTDFNDLAVREGLDVAAAQIRAAGAPAANDNTAAQPLDLFAEFPAPPMEPGMLPEVIGDYARECGELIGVDPSMVAMPALVACAAALHDDVQIQPKRHETGWTESARLWCAVVGSPSVRKTPAIKRATKRLRHIDRELADENARAAAEYADQIEQWKEAKKEARKVGGTVPEPQKPAMARMVVEDTTIEALSEVLKDNRRGVLSIQDELSGWFGSMDAYTGGKAGSKDRAAWLQAYNGGFRQVDRVQRGAVHIPNFSVSMIGGIQPDAIRRIAKDMTDDGLMQRFMIVIGRNQREMDRPEDARAMARFGWLVEHLHAIQPTADPVKLSDDAHVVREALMTWAGELADYPALPGGLRSHLGKWAGLFARLLLTYHAIDCAHRKIHPVHVEVSGETAARVDRLMRRFLFPHALAYYTDILGASGDLEHARWVAGHILSKRLDAVTNRELVSGYKQWRGLDDWRRQRVMQMLEDMSWLTPVVDEGRASKRGATSWTVNPRVHQVFEAKARDEAERRDRVRAEIAALRR